MSAIAMPELVTTGELERTLGAPKWLVRQVVDQLGLVAARAGQYRLIRVEDVALVEAELARRATSRQARDGSHWPGPEKSEGPPATTPATPRSSNPNSWGEGPISEKSTA